MQNRKQRRQAVNPFLPLDRYIPDGEPHVFGDRVYLFGSHDKEGGEAFCLLSYEIFSAPVDDLGNWTSKGINYRAEQDPLSKETGRPFMYAPDCVRGNDGRYYLYYCLSADRGSGGYEGPISVAVCDTPDGQYEFYGHVRFEDGTLCKRYIPFDPAVINDEGKIRLYYGTWFPFDTIFPPLRPVMRRVMRAVFGKSKQEMEGEPGGVMGAVVCTLKDDMLTIEGQPKRFLNNPKGSPFESRMSLMGKDGHMWYGHGFFEASSIRKIGKTYYFIYSSVNGHELCYATSDRFDGPFRFGGTIVSNGDVGYRGRAEKDRLNHTSTNHGSIEQIGGQWYVFYHRQTHGSDYSRQACAEKIAILPDGSIPQVEITSCGLNGGDLQGTGEYPAVICCNLTNGKMPHGNVPAKRRARLPMVTHSKDERYLTNLSAGTTVNYKYFDLSDTRQIVLRARGEGTILVGGLQVKVKGKSWADYHCTLRGSRHAVLSLQVIAGNVDILSFTLIS